MYGAGGRLSTRGCGGRGFTPSPALPHRGGGRKRSRSFPVEGEGEKDGVPFLLAGAGGGASPPPRPSPVEGGGEKDGVPFLLAGAGGGASPPPRPSPIEGEGEKDRVPSPSRGREKKIAFLPHPGGGRKRSRSFPVEGRENKDGVPSPFAGEGQGGGGAAEGFANRLALAPAGKATILPAAAAGPPGPRHGPHFRVRPNQKAFRP